MQRLFKAAGMTAIEYDNYLTDDRAIPSFHPDKRKWVWVRRDRVREMRFAPAGDD
jgi:hypothetical protein